MKTSEGKRYILSFFALLLLLLLLLCLPACGTILPSTTSSATPMPSNSSNIPSGKGMNPEPGTNGKPAPLPNGHSESIIISNGVAYVGSDNGSLYALDTAGGDERWSYKIGASVSVFSISNDVVYATGNTGLYALKAGNGKLLWRYQGNKLISQVIVVAGVVYTATAAGNNASTIVALRAADGSQLWNYTVGTITPPLMGVLASVVYVAGSSQGPDGFSTGPIYALQASDGHVLWQTRPGGSKGLANGGVVTAGGLVYFVTSQDYIYALRTDTGNMVWHAVQPSEPGMPNAPTPVLANGLLYIAGDLGLFVYKADDGALLWQYKNLVPAGPVVVPPLVVNGVVYFSGGGERIVALQASDGKVIWSYSGPGNVFSPLTFENGVVINDTGPVYALRASDGTLLWQQNVSISGEGSDAAGPETIGDGVVLVGGDNGVVQAIRVSDGKLLWHYAIQELPVESPPVYSAFIFFASSLSYQQALEIVTSLGLKTFADCQFGSWVTSDNKNFFSNAHEMTVLATVSSAPLWFERLKTTAGIQMVQPDGPHSCPMIPAAPAGTKYLPSSQANTYLGVTFISTTRYATALDAINGLGFRLAAPCYEQARARGNKPGWSAMDQSSAFNQSHTLILATTTVNAVTWKSQLQAVTGVVKVNAPFKATC
ncbi:MAG TPA: PQQ-binding-like beta-propeller repeat protein [Ktedonobacteraceae bacterium]|nr:PQQ-binding-like beta-propeller repeat protein [Ktedonobacteraceae bacterium]